MIIGKRYIPNRLSFTVRTSLVGFVSCITMGITCTLVHEHVHRVYFAVLQFACMNPILTCALLTSMHASANRCAHI